MRNQKFLAGLTAVLAIFIATLCMETRAVAQQESVLYNFSAYLTDAYFPYSGLIFDAAGNLYGTTTNSGASCAPSYNCGAVFELLPQSGGGWTEIILHSFNNNGTDGYAPFQGLVLDAAGNLYGTTYRGGAHGVGTVFELTPATGGGWTEKVLYSFSCKNGGACNPVASLILDGVGNLYGTTQGGGAYYAGSVFELMPQAGGGWAEKILHSFNNNGKDGVGPQGNLLFDASGNLYGTTLGGGAYNYGTVLEMRRTPGGWAETVLHSFQSNGSDGNRPNPSLVFDAVGNLYGTTFSGGVADDGTVFELSPASGGRWTEKVLHRFIQNATDGRLPAAGLVLGASGKLYGTTTVGGTYRVGTVFELLPSTGGNWTETILYSFNPSTVTDGIYPYSALVLDAAGNLYGTTCSGGTYGGGNVFEVTP